MKKKKLNVIGLAMIIFIGVFGFGNIANNYKEVGTSAITMFILGAVLFFLPLSLIMAEFGAYAKERTAGIYSWIEIGLGKNLAYIAIWSYFVANIFYLPTLATRVPTYLSFFAYGDANVGNGPMATLAAVTIIAAIFVGIKYEKEFEIISKYVGYLSLFISFIFILGGLYVFATGGSSTVLTLDSLKIDFSNKASFAAFLSTFAWIVFAFGGSEVCGIYITDVENPEKNFFKGIMLASLIIAVFYVLGVLAISTFGTGEEFSQISLINAVISGYKFMGDKLGLGLWFVRFIGLSYALITLIALVLWSVALAKSVFSEVPEGTFPQWLTCKTEGGILKNALIFQSFLAILFILITTFGGDKAGELYYKIYDMSTMAFIFPYFFLTISYIAFRKKGLVSPYQVSKSNTTAIAVGVLVTSMLLISFIFAGIDISTPIAEQMDTIKLYYGGLLGFLFIGGIVKLLNRN